MQLSCLLSKNLFKSYLETEKSSYSYVIIMKSYISYASDYWEVAWGQQSSFKGHLGCQINRLDLLPLCINVYFLFFLLPLGYKNQSMHRKHRYFLYKIVIKSKLLCGALIRCLLLIFISRYWHILKLEQPKILQILLN